MDCIVVQCVSNEYEMRDEKGSKRKFGSGISLLFSKSTKETAKINVDSYLDPAIQRLEAEL